MKLAKYILPAVFVLFSLGIFDIKESQAQIDFADVVSDRERILLESRENVGIGGDCTISSQCAGNGAICHSDGYCYFPLGEGPQGIGEILKIITRIADWIFAIFIAISVIFILWGAFDFVTSEGNPEKISSAKKRLLYAAIGIALALLANGVDDILRSILIR